MTVIKKTRRKIFTVTAAIIVFTVTAFCASILIPTYMRNTRTADMILKNMIDSFNRVPPTNENFQGGGYNRIDDLRGFTFKINNDFVIEEIHFYEDVFTIEEIGRYILEISKVKKERGRMGDIEFLVQNTPDGKITACLDIGVENALFNELLLTVVVAGSGSMLALLLLVWFLSYWIVKPAANAFKNQRRFISEAGHELKTPLTVISASLELLTKSTDEAEQANRIKIIKEQTEKLNVMTAELLSLSKIEEKEKAAKAEFDLSQTVLTEALAFESVAFENGKMLLCKTEENIIYKGDFKSVSQALSILCDNAVKHSDSGGLIEVRLEKQGGKAVLTVSNSSSLVRNEELPFLFERFYRGSESRAAVPGAGLGLAILKTLAVHNGWKLGAEAENGIITFSIIF